MLLDLFGNDATPAASEEVKKKRLAGLKVRIMDYHKERKYQSFTANEIVKAFPNEKPERVLQLINSLKKSVNLVATGENRGTGFDNQCFKINPRRK